MGYSKKNSGKKLISKIEKGQPGGNLYACVDLPDGEWSVDEINARVAAQADQFVEQYQTTSMGDNDKAPTPGEQFKPTSAVVVRY
jgi:hypothetical protein